MNFQDPQIVSLLDKVGIAIFLLLVGYLLNRYIESYKSRKALENQSAQMRATKRIELLERRLSEFYWPLYVRLEKDRTIWRQILGVTEEPGTSDHRFAVAIENDVIIPNHREMIELIETRIHLAQPDEKLMAILMLYVKRATEYLSLRGSGEAKRFSRDETGSDWLHQELFDEIKAETEALQAKYNALVEADWESVGQS